MRRIGIVLSAALLLVGAADPRPELVELQLASEYEAALEQVDLQLAVNPDQARPWGFEYLRGHILEQLQRDTDAPQAFTAAMTSAPAVSAYSRYRLARNRMREEQPRIAAGLLATLLANEPPAALQPEAIRLLASAMAKGGDCELLDGADSWNLKPALDRQLQVPRIDCAITTGDIQDARSRALSVLRKNRNDETAHHSAERLARLSPGTPDAQISLLIAITFFQHRAFRRAIPYLETSLENPEVAAQELRDVDKPDILYKLARSHYWLGQYPLAAERFALAAAAETESDKAARNLFQRGRSLALEGDWDRAVDSYHEAVAADPLGSWAAAALLSAMRLEWRQGSEEPALEIFQKLRHRRSWRSTLQRAALFLATSDLVRNRADRAGRWLDLARQARRRDGPEIWYWRGRLAELESQPDAAVRSYGALLTADPYHPLAVAARARLHHPDLENAARARSDRLAASGRTSDLIQAWVLSQATPPTQLEIHQKLWSRWSRSSQTQRYLEMTGSPPAEWTLWQRRIAQPEDLLLTLGIIEVMSATVRSSFPLDDTALALAGSRLLASSGLHQRSLYNAEVIRRRVPAVLPDAFLPADFRRLLYPRPYEYLAEQQARRFGVDPLLLTAIIREESRFDPTAISGASARGLTQFVLPTAQRLGQKLDWPELESSDLYRPEIAITLGAAYLAELQQRFDGSTSQSIAAYNAGEDQARLWQGYCFSQEPEEYFTKVGFRQTRAYLEKVLKSRAQYEEIYSASIESSSGGSDS